MYNNQDKFTKITFCPLLICYTYIDLLGKVGSLCSIYSSSQKNIHKNGRVSAISYVLLTAHALIVHVYIFSTCVFVIY